jgi:hypothetical protein
MLNTRLQIYLFEACIRTVVARSQNFEFNDMTSPGSPGPVRCNFVRSFALSAKVRES